MTMKKRMNIVWLLLLGMSMVACHDDNDAEPSAQLNKYRAKEITGHNALWGDFKIRLNYIDNRLDFGFIMNGDQDTIGRLTSSSVMMKVPAISQEEIDQLEPGSSIPIKYQSIFSIQRKTNQEVVYHYKQENSQYILDYSENYLFEYDDTLKVNPRIMKWRRIGDANTDDPLMRMVYAYDGERVISGEFATYTTSWDVRTRVEYRYEGGRLASIVETAADGRPVSTKTFAYTGTDRLRVTTEEGDGARSVDYTLNADGYVTRVDEGDGNYMEVQYEAGHGNLGSLVSNVVKMEGEPYIK